MIPTLLINLDRSTDRLAQMQREFQRVGLAFERFPGVNGTDLPPSIRPYFCNAAGRIVSPLQPGEIGCYASHLSVWQRVAAGTHGAVVLVCEDDIVLPDDLASLIDAAVAVAPEGWDMIRLSSPSAHPMLTVAPLEGERRLVRYWREPAFAGAYLVSRRGAGKLLKTGTRRKPVDIDIARPWAFGIELYGVSPVPVLQPEVPSPTEDMGGRAHRLHRRNRIFRRPSFNKIGRLAYNLQTFGWRQWLAYLIAAGGRR
jgi:glycosyl transferase, family 25